MGNLSCSFIEIEFPAFLNFFFCANRECQLLYCSYQFQPVWNCAKPLKNSQLCSRLYMLQSVPPPPRLCSILWVSFVFLILLRGFSAVSHGEWTRPGLKTLSWRCFFWFFLDNALCVFHWSWCTLCTITVAGPELCYWDPFKLCGRHYPITDGSILSSRH